MRSTFLHAPFALLALAVPLMANAADFHVDSIRDDDVGSLRAAIDWANATPGPDRILFEGGLEGRTLSIEAPAPVITDAVELVGPPNGAAIVQSTGADRVLQIRPDQGAAVVIRGLVFSGGRAPAGNGGGCIEVERADLLLDNVRITGCEATFGGGIATSNGAAATFRHSRIDGNRALQYGGGIHSYGTVLIEQSEIDHNRADGSNYPSGGGLQVAAFVAGQLSRVVASHFHHNSVQSSKPGAPGSSSTGGAINAARGNFVVENSSFYANRAYYGAAINRTGYPGEAQTTHIVGSTFARNHGNQIVSVLTGGLYLGHSTLSDNQPHSSALSRAHALSVSNGMPLQVFGSVVSGNYPDADGDDVDTGGTPVTADFSLVGSATSGSFDPNNPGTNLFGIAPQLGPLRWNGGPTPTMLPLPGSPLIDRSTDTDMPATDQRGFTRLLGLTVDIGAVESDGDRLFSDDFEPGPAD